MLYLTHLHPASARSATVRPAPGSLAFIGHTSIDILALPTDEAESSTDAATPAEPFSKLSTLSLNARILQALTLPVVPGSLLLLTDHPAPRLIVLTPDPAAKQQDELTPTAYTTHTVVQLQDVVRSPAELGVGMAMDTFSGLDASHTPVVFTHTYSGNARVVPLPVDALVRPPSAQNGIGALAGFDVRLPHPTLIQSTFLDSRNFEAGPFPPLIALLSLSSTPTSLPGLGPQCLPVLSFHWLDLDKQELAPCPWGPAPTPTPSSPLPGKTNKASASTAEENASTSAAASGRRRSGRLASSPAGNSRTQTYGPSAKGADRSPAAIIARDKKLAAQGLTRAHVPIPYIEALGAHFLLALPARAGGGVLVFSETCILLVPLPPSVCSHGSSNNAPTEREMDIDFSASNVDGGVAGRQSPAKGKRRKAANTGTDAFAAASSTSPHEASSTVNEHGKRRRASETVAGSSRDILRTAFRKPMQIVAAIVQAEPSGSSGAASDDDGVREIDADGRTAAIRVLFGTQAGTLHSLVISLTSGGGRADGKRMYAALSMQVSKLGPIPRPGSGSGGLLYLGGGFLQVASMIGDSALVRIDPGFTSGGKADNASSLTGVEAADAGTQSGEDWEDGSMEVDQAGHAAPGKGVQEFRRFPNLAPILDFVIDHGVTSDEKSSPEATASSPSSASANLATRLVTCSGTGPSGSIRSVRTGAELTERGSVSLGSEVGPEAVFNLAMEDDESSVVLLSYPERTSAFIQSTVGGDLHWAPLSTSEPEGESTLAAAALGGAGNVFVTVSSGAARVWSWSGTDIELQAEWRSSSLITVAAIDASGRILLADGARTLTLLQAQRQGAHSIVLEQVSARVLEDGVASLHLQTLQDSRLGDTPIASIGYFVKRTVRLLQLPDLRDITPELLSMQTFSALPTCVLVHSLGKGSSYLFIGFTDGNLVSFRLDFAENDDGIAGSSSAKLGIGDRRTVSLGPTPVRSLVPLRTTRYVEGILAAGEKPVLLYEQNGRLNYSALSFGSLGAASATLPPYPQASDVLLVRSNANPIAGPARQATPASLHMLQLGDNKKVEIETLPLGCDNPIGIALGANEGKAAFGVITWKYLPEGEGAVVDAKGKAKRGKGARGKVLAIDRDTFETIDTFELEAAEHPHCIESVTLLNGRTLFVIGTGWDNPMESETLSGRIIGLELVPSRWKSGDREFSLAFSQKVRGGVNAVVGPQGHLVAAINSQVVLYQTVPSKSAARELSLQRKGAWACAFFATTLVSPREEPDRLLVGDAMRSMVVLSLNVEAGKLSEIARECDPSWTSAVEQLSSVSQHYVGADMSFNLFTSARTLVTSAVRRRKEALAQAEGTDLLGNAREAGPGERSSNKEPPLEKEFTHVIKRRGGFHLGDMVNRFRKGALLHPEGLDVLGDTIKPNILFCTAGGALGLLADIGNRAGSLLAGLVQAIDDETPPLGRISIREWRAFRTDHREMAAVGFVDGDELVDKFLRFDDEDREAIVQRWKEEMGEQFEDVGQIGEDRFVDAVTGLARLV